MRIGKALESFPVSFMPLPLPVSSVFQRLHSLDGQPTLTRVSWVTCRSIFRPRSASSVSISLAWFRAVNTTSIFSFFVFLLFGKAPGINDLVGSHLPKLVRRDTEYLSYLGCYSNLMKFRQFWCVLVLRNYDVQISRYRI